MQLRLFQLENKHLHKVGLCEKIIVNEEPKEVEDQTVDDQGEIIEGEEAKEEVFIEPPPRRKKRKGIKFVRANEPLEKELKPLRKLVKAYNVLLSKMDTDGAEVSRENFNEWHEDVPEEYRQESVRETFDLLGKTIEVLEAKLKKTKSLIKLALDDLAAHSQIFKRFRERFDELYAIEKSILTDAEEVFSETELWRYFNSVKGLGPMAALTMLGNVDVFISATVGNAWSNAGLIPGKTLVRGEISHFNPQYRARILGVICNNIIRMKDPYYYGIYQIKKAYHQNRPDLLALKPNEPKSWGLHMHRMSYRVLGKMIVSHSYSLIKKDLGSGTLEVFHRNPLPIKPSTQAEVERVLGYYLKNHTMMLEKLKPLWEKYESIVEPEKPVITTSGDVPESSVTAIPKYELSIDAYNEKMVKYRWDKKAALDAYNEELKHPTITFEK